MKRYSMVKLPLIISAKEGNIEAINKIVRHYSGHITRLSLRPMIDESGRKHLIIDNELRQRLEIKLRNKIIKFEIR